ncbi:MAG: formyltransferase family protein [Bacteroidia bacterium]|nr:formyltransferase family protein [Bacteroidia bacterium]
MENEGIINYLVVFNKPGRKYTKEIDTRWGGLIEPAKSEDPVKTDAGLRVVLFASWDFGYIVLKTLKEFENKYPGQLNIVGLVTDDPLSPNAKISLKKRVWSLLDMPYRVIDETFIIESGLSHGIPVYTGEVKVNSFHDILKKWNPDVILVCVFGQIIDSFTLKFPGYGIYNFHPSDLSLHQGIGPAPYEDLAIRKAKTAVWSVHQVIEEVDGGLVIGKSPPVCVLDLKGELPHDPLIVYHKLAEVLSPMVFFMMTELSGKFELKIPGKLEYINFENLIPDKIKTKIMLPATHDLWSDVLNIPVDFLYKPG